MSDPTEIIIENGDTGPDANGAAAPTTVGTDDAIGRVLVPRTLAQLDRHRRATAARIRGH